MQSTQTELQRLIDNLIRIGAVTAVRSGECRVKTGDIITNWRPYAAARAENNRPRHYPARVQGKVSENRCRHSVAIRPKTKRPLSLVAFVTL